MKKLFEPFHLLPRSTYSYQEEMDFRRGEKSSQKKLTRFKEGFLK